ncbi:MAG TPA: hypothetical protein VFD43_06320, partial [Planctomycetota bacterium]|nr:hypothetical protein [Planctomycetota bacterium]
RLQVLPLMALFAAIAVDWALRKLRARRAVPLVAAGLLFALLLGWTRRPAEPKPFDEQSRDGAMIFQLVKAGNYERALVFLDRLRRQKSSPEGLVTDRNLAAKLETLASAFPHFEQAMAWPDDSAERHLHTGRGLAALLPLTKRGERREFTGLARVEFETALRLDAEIEGAHVGLGHVAALNEEPSGAYAEFMAELELHPDNAAAHTGIGFLQDGFGQSVEALRHYRCALAAGAEDARVLAAAAYIEINPLFRDTPPIRAGGRLDPVYDPPRALERARRALELAPDDVFVCERAAYALYANGVEHIDEAVGLLRRVQREQPERSGEIEGRIQGILSLKPAEDGPPPDEEPATADEEPPP